MFNLKTVLAAALLLVGQGAAIGSQHHGKKWVDIWGSMPQLTEQHNLPPEPFQTPDGVLFNTTVRSTHYITHPANTIRLQLSNAFGTTPLPITALTVSLPHNTSQAGTPHIQPSTLIPVTFGGRPSFSIPTGSVVLSDPIPLTVEAESNIAISIYLAEGQTGREITSHPGSRTDSWFTRGNFVNALTFPGAEEEVEGVETVKIAHWYFISAIEGWVPSSTKAMVVIGDSITDGRGSTTNGNNRWPDQLLSLMRDRRTGTHWSKKTTVINEAAGGNRILNDGLGPNALSRIDRDVIAQSGVGYAMILMGVNDIGTTATDSSSQAAVAGEIIWALDQIVTRLHRVGIPVFGGTITPMSGPGQSYGDGDREVTRQTVNDWIRTGGRFEEVVDFDAAVRNDEGGYPERLRPEFDDGDFLHLSVEGYGAMAEAFDLGVFRRWAGGYNGMD